jgi:hypothetical protein
VARISDQADGTPNQAPSQEQSSQQIAPKSSQPGILPDRNGTRTVAMRFDVVEHDLLIQAGNGTRKALALFPRSAWRSRSTRNW